MVQKRYKSPPPENYFFPPSPNTSFLDSFRTCFALIFPYFAFTLFYPFTPIFSFSSPFFLSFPFSFTFYPFSLTHFIFFPQKTSTDIPPRGRGIFRYIDFCGIKNGIPKIGYASKCSGSSETVRFFTRYSSKNVQLKLLNIFVLLLVLVSAIVHRKMLLLQIEQLRMARGLT